MNNLETHYGEIAPGKFYLKADLDTIETYLRDHFFLDPTEAVIHAEKPGEGNMNYVLRVRTNIRSFIVKQARPWVEKYPQIPAPVERNAVEARYFRLVEKSPALKSFSPQLLYEDVANNMLILSDLGQANDYSSIYREGNLEEAELKAIVSYLSALHRIHEPSYPRNGSMRTLNHEHIFQYPFDPQNGLDLDQIQPGLRDLAGAVQKNQPLKKRIEALGKIYLSQGDVLIHGDFYPGSWLQSSGGFKVIDPEFSFNGIAEFDVAVLVAHLMLAGQPDAHLNYILHHCQEQNQLEVSLIADFCGTEILRRILGVAQLPLRWNLNELQQLVDQAVNCIMTGKIASTC